jgi:hypothetical protein
VTTPPPDMMGGFVLDAAALLELTAGPNLYGATFARMAALQGLTLLIPAAALSEAWQTTRAADTPPARLGLLLDGPMVVVEPLTGDAARAAGELLTGRPTIPPDVPAAQVATACRARGWPALTADPARLLALDPHLRITKLPGV